MPAKPRTGTRTKAQNKRASRVMSGPFLNGLMGNTIAAAHPKIDGLLDSPPPSYDTYRLMRCNPTIAIARAALFAPVKASAWSFEADDGTPDDRVKFIQDQLEPLRMQVLADALRSVEYGWQPFERVYAYEAGRVGYQRIKSLLPDYSEPIIDKDTGQLLGVRNCGVDLTLAQGAIVTYDAEGDDPYGRSIYENLREFAWWPWQDASKKLAQYMTKGAGVIPMVHYPMGTAKDQEGQTAANSEGAALLLRSLANGAGVTIPNQISPGLEDLLRGNANVDQLAAWRISFLETRSGVGNEIIEAMRHYEKLMVRGMLQPERSILEGQSGTRADAGSHADLALTMATEMLNWITARISALFVDPLLVVNFGLAARGTVYITPAPIRDDDREFLKNLMMAVLTANPDLLMAVADFDAMLDTVGVPKSAEVVDVATATGQATTTMPAPPNGQGSGGPPTPPLSPQPNVMASLARQVKLFRQMGIA